jgi:hypothetical protein
MLLMAATYTYGPILGLFAFGLMTKRKVHDKWVWLIALISVAISLTLGLLPAEMLGGYEFNYELLIVNGGITFLGLWLIRKR